MTLPERFPRDDPREWLNRAHSNLARAKLWAPSVYLEDLCFDAQQAAEKAVSDDEGEEHDESDKTTTLRLVGTVPPEAWNRIGFKILTKMKSGIDLLAGIDLSVTVDRGMAAEMLRELGLAVNDLGQKDRLRVRRDDE